MPRLVRLFHRTYHVHAILAEGFRDSEDNYLTDTSLRGVWLSNIPLDDSEGADGDQVLQIDLPDAEAVSYEVVEEGKPYREFLIPADVLNRYGPPRLLSAEELDAMIDPRFPAPTDWDTESNE